MTARRSSATRPSTKGLCAQPVQEMKTDAMGPTAFSRAGNLATFIRGHGPSVVFLHAGVADSRMWQHQIEAVGHNHRAIAYDRRGFGATPAADVSYSDVGDLIAVLDEFAPNLPAIVIGCSNGGRIAIDAALAAPGRIGALILVAPSIGGAPPGGYPDEAKPTIEALEAAESARDLDRVNELEAQLWLDGPLARPGRVRGAARQLFLDMNGIALRSPKLGQALKQPPAYPRLHEIGTPTLVIWGSCEFPDISRLCQHLVDEIPEAQGQIMRDVAHLPSLERPVEVTGLIARFIDRLGEARPSRR